MAGDILPLTASRSSKGLASGSSVQLAEPVLLRSGGFTLDINSVISFLFITTIVAFFSCIFLSIKNDWDSSTSTHCHVENYLPSISSAIGGYTPQKYIWRIAISFQLTPRVMYAGVYLRHNLAQEYNLLDHVAYPTLCNFLFVGTITELCGLCLLTYVASTDSYFFHKLGFIAFVVFSVVNQLVHVSINRCQFRKLEDPGQLRLYKRKRLLSIFHVSSIVFSMYFFWRHNAYCEPGMYTVFAFFEYVVVVTNILFHYAFVWDFEGSVLSVVHRTNDAKYSLA